MMCLTTSEAQSTKNIVYYTVLSSAILPRFCINQKLIDVTGIYIFCFFHEGRNENINNFLALSYIYSFEFLNPNFISLF